MPLLVVAGLPLIDGYYLGFLLRGVDPAAAVSFAFTGFSGPACIAAVTKWTGSWRKRFVQFLAVYAVVWSGAILLWQFKPFLDTLKHDVAWSPFTGVFLLALGLEFTGVSILRQAAAVTGYRAIPRVLLLALAIQAILWGFTESIRSGERLNSLHYVLLALSLGSTLTFLGAVLGLAAHRVAFERRPLDMTAGIALFALGMQVFGEKRLPVVFKSLFYSYAIVGLLVIGVAMAFLWPVLGRTRGHR